MEPKSFLGQREKMRQLKIQESWLYAQPGPAYSGNGAALESVLVQTPGHPGPHRPSRWLKVEISLSLSSLGVREGAGISYYLMCVKDTYAPPFGVPSSCNRNLPWHCLPLPISPFLPSILGKRYLIELPRQ